MKLESGYVATGGTLVWAKPVCGVIEKITVGMCMC